MSHLGNCCSGSGTSAQPVAPQSRRTTPQLAAQTTPPQPIVNDATLKKNIDSSISKRVADLSKDPTAALGKAQAICEKTIQMATDLSYTNVQDALRTAATACKNAQANGDNSNASEALNNAANALWNIDPTRHITRNHFALDAFVKLSAISKVIADDSSDSDSLNYSDSEPDGMRSITTPNAAEASAADRFAALCLNTDAAAASGEDDDIAGGGGARSGQDAAAFRTNANDALPQPSSPPNLPSVVDRRKIAKATTGARAADLSRLAQQDNMRFSSLSRELSRTGSTT